MRAKYETVAIQQHASFVCFRVQAPAFAFNWHRHPELELTLIVRGHGRRLAGDAVDHFGPGDLVLLGPMLPHTWAGELQPGEVHEAVVVQFPVAFINALANFPEMVSIQHLMRKAAYGIAFKQQVGKKVQQLMEKLVNETGSASLMILLQLLDILSRKQGKALSRHLPPHALPEVATKRISKVLGYIDRQYHSTISLEAAAALVSLSKSAFCKFFKKQVGRQFSEYVNEIRISRAALLLTEGEQPIKAIAAACGFDNLSYFNRIFLQMKGVTPGQFRQRYTV